MVSPDYFVCIYSAVWPGAFWPRNLCLLSVKFWKSHGLVILSSVAQGLFFLLKVNFQYSDACREKRLLTFLPFLCPKGGRASLCHIGLFTRGFVYFQYGNALSTVSFCFLSSSDSWKMTLLRVQWQVIIKQFCFCFLDISTIMIFPDNLYT